MAVPWQNVETEIWEGCFNKEKNRGKPVNGHEGIFAIHMDDCLCGRAGHYCSESGIWSCCGETKEYCWCPKSSCTRPAIVATLEITPGDVDSAGTVSLRSLAGNILATIEAGDTKLPLTLGRLREAANTGAADLTITAAGGKTLDGPDGMTVTEALE